MSAYDNVIGGKLKLKGKALDVKAGGVKKKKKHKKQEEQALKVTEHELIEGRLDRVILITTTNLLLNINELGKSDMLLIGYMVFDCRRKRRSIG